jgi:hypothetical protein
MKIENAWADYHKGAGLSVNSAKVIEHHQLEAIEDNSRKHVLFMLVKLYTNILDEEATFEKLRSSEEGCFDKEFDNLDLEKKWYWHLYKECGPVVGPVGERPLHVCCLNAFRSESVHFEGSGGRYVSQGILKGMMEFIKCLTSGKSPAIDVSQNSEAEKMIEKWMKHVNDPGKQIGKEVIATYGKDYCAVVGTFLLNDSTRNWDDTKTFLPPFWRQICKWKTAHLQSLGTYCCRAHGGSELFAKLLVSAGMYEGETILLPLIANRAADKIKELLQLNSRSSNLGTLHRPHTDL